MASLRPKKARSGKQKGSEAELESDEVGSGSSQEQEAARLAEEMRKTVSHQLMGLDISGPLI